MKAIDKHRFNLTCPPRNPTWLSRPEPTKTSTAVAKRLGRPLRRDADFLFSRHDSPGLTEHQ
jgi:hypothetical protein